MRTYFLLLIFLIFSAPLTAQENGFANLSKVSFWDYQLVEQITTISGMLNGYNRETDSFSTARVQYEPLLQSSDYERSTIFEIDAGGSFSFNVPMASPQELLLIFGDELITMYAVPGRTHELAVDWSELKAQSKLPFEQKVISKPPVSFNGDLAG